MMTRIPTHNAAGEPLSKSLSGRCKKVRPSRKTRGREQGGWRLDQTQVCREDVKLSAGVLRLLL